MKAVVCNAYGGPEVLEIVEREKPTPGPKEVLIRIQASVVAPSDCAYRKGEPFMLRLFSGLSRPKSVPGDLFSGAVVAVGDGVTRFAVGDEVFGAAGTSYGCHAELLGLAETAALVKKPPMIDHAAAVSLCDGGLTALPFLRDQARLEAGQRILIIGASGSVGTYAVQLAKHLGAHVTGVCSTRNLELVRGLGADAVIDYTAEDFTARDETYDAVFDAVAKSSYSSCKGILTPRGRYLTTVPSLGIMLQMLATKLFSRRRVRFAATGLNKPAQKIADLNYLLGLLGAGRLRPVIDRRYPLAEIVAAHHYVETGRKRGNVIIEVAEPT
jgi:NADPH:quinone reductase-like Zn-dependent oxidoreductase